MGSVPLFSNSASGDHGRHSARALWLALLLVGGYYAMVARFYRPPEPRPTDALPAQFSATRAMAVWRSLDGSAEPHAVGSAAHDRLRTAIQHRLQELGLETELQTGWACDAVYECARVTNVIARLPGSDPQSRSVLFAAHYDSVPAGPGAGDDGSGVATVLEAVRALQARPPLRHPVQILIDDGEEAGLLGARVFVGRHPEARRVGAVVNLDARGDSGPSLMFETGDAVRWTLGTYARAAPQPLSNSLYFFIYKLLPNDTDFTIFKAAGMQGVNLAFIGGVQHYHTDRDRIELLNPGTLQHTGDNALASVAALGDADLSAPRPERAVFFDVLGRALLVWPAALALPMALLLTLLCGWALASLARRAGIGAWAVLRAAAAVVGGWLAVSALAVGLLSLLRWLGAVPPAGAYRWTAHPGPVICASVALAALAPAATLLLYGRSLPRGAHWLAQSWITLLALLFSSWRLPELSFLFVVPALILVIVAACSLRRTAAQLRAEPVSAGAALLPLLASAFTVLPSLHFTYPALGVLAWPVITACAAWLALWLIVPLQRAARGPRRFYVGIAAAALIVGAAIGAGSPLYSERVPERMNLWYLQDADGESSHWLLRTDSGRMPAALAVAAEFAPDPVRLPGVDAPRFSAPAPMLRLAPPVAQLIEVRRIAGQGSEPDRQSVRLRLRSERGAPQLLLKIPKAAGLRRMSLLVGPQPLPVAPWRARDGTNWLLISNAAAEGVDVELDVDTLAAGDTPLELLDRSFGLPLAAAGRLTTLTSLVRSQDGDLTIVSARLPVPAP